jgi:battenin
LIWFFFFWIKRNKFIKYIFISFCYKGIIILIISSTANKNWGFYTALVGSVICGSTQALGEAVILGYLKAFPSDLVSGWSSGTGMAGIMGSGSFLLLHGVAKLSIAEVFLFLFFLNLKF